MAAVPILRRPTAPTWRSSSRRAPGWRRPDAERRVAEVTERMKQALNEARRATAHFALWLTAALLCGAGAAAWAATEGGEWRDGIRT